VKSYKELGFSDMSDISSNLRLNLTSVDTFKNAKVFNIQKFKLYEMNAKVDKE